MERPPVIYGDPPLPPQPHLTWHRAHALRPPADGGDTCSSPRPEFASCSGRLRPSQGAARDAVGKEKAERKKAKERGRVNPEKAEKRRAGAKRTRWQRTQPVLVLVLVAGPLPPCQAGWAQELPGPCARRGPDQGQGQGQGQIEPG
jgi:hypothetical protein